jgi:hypothetical protein
MQIEKPSKRDSVLLILLGVLVILIIPLIFEESRVFIIAIFWRVFFFAKKHIVALFISFFLINGKFIWFLFLKKIAMLGAIGLGKRYVTEKIFIHNFKKHFLIHISDEIRVVKEYIHKNFNKTPILKQIIAGITFITSLGILTKFMGIFLALKVILARMWSMLLAIFLKVGVATAYFFTDYLYNTWIIPIIEILIFSWFLELLERVPVINRLLKKVYKLFISTFREIERILNIFFHIPMRNFFTFLVYKVQYKVRKLVGAKILSSYSKLKDKRESIPNLHTKIILKRAVFKEKKRDKKGYISYYDRLKVKRLK